MTDLYMYLIDKEVFKIYLWSLKLDLYVLKIMQPKNVSQKFIFCQYLEVPEPKWFKFGRGGRGVKKICTILNLNT